ncbi:MAG: tetratricopeptide repeat protein [bacterium]|jgi:Flp pilus assembly protein TadD
MSTLRRLASRYAVPAALAVLAFAVYWRVGSFPFIHFDDDTYILRNPSLHGGLSFASIRWAFTNWKEIGWLPLTWLSHLLDVSLFGMDAGKQHLVNLLFHVANTLLLFHVLRRTTGKTWESGLVAALFSVHPLHVESVVWVSERKDVLSTFFWMLSLESYARYAERPGVARYGTVVLFFVLGLLSKPMVVTLPLVLLLLDFWPLGRLWPAADSPDEGSVRYSPASPGRLLLEKAPLMLLSAVFCMVTYLSQEGMGAVNPMWATPLWSRAGNALLSYAVYLSKAVWPSKLAVFYPHPGTNLELWKAVSSGLLLCTVTALVVRGAFRRRWLATGWFWFLGTLVPVIGLVQVGGQAMADRYTYVPLIGPFLVAAWGGGELASRWRIPKGMAAGVWLAALAACAWVQTGYWRGTVPLFEHALEVTEDNWIAHFSLGVSATESGRDDEAIARYREAIRIYPAFAAAHNNLGAALLKVGRPDEAIFHIREALRLDPESPDAHNNLGIHLARIGRSDEAIAQYREALRIRPGYAEAHHSLGMELARTGKPDEAIRHLRQAVRSRPDYVEAHNNLGVFLARRGELPEAVSEFREALRLKPDYAAARKNLERAAAGWRR